MDVDLNDRKILQASEKDLVEAFSNFCYQNNLKYFIMGGTLLGAVRHQGFIPWDDDVDVGMPRPDFERFQKLMSENGNVLNDFPFRNYENSDTIEYVARLENPNVKIEDSSAAITEKRNSWMDIFPLDGMPKSKWIRKIHGLNLLRLRMLLKYSQFDRISVNMTERPLVEKLLIKVGKLIKPEKHLDTRECLNNLDHALKRFPYKRATYVVNFMGAYKLKEMFPKKYYESSKAFEFEDLSLVGSPYFDEILTQMYGSNYMTPPSEQIKNKHFTKVLK